MPDDDRALDDVAHKIDEAKAAARDVAQPGADEACDRTAPTDPPYEETEEGFTPA